MTTRATLEAPEESLHDHAAPEGLPALVAVHSSRAIAVTIPVGTRVGRDRLAELGVDDDLVSREHFDLDRRGDAIVLADRGSRNGTFVDGARVTSDVTLAPGSVVRAGKTVFLVVRDGAAFERAPPRREGDLVVGPTTAPLLARAAALGRLGQLLVTGASGAGKELVARAFHGDRAARPFVAVNCATVAPGIAERLLFGSKRGAYTGAEQDAEGFVRAANGGTLFLDEVGELDLGVQAKLLRFLETREYFAVGDTRPVVADVRVCFATLRDLDDDVASGRFRADLFHRIASPKIEVPPLAARREEIPLLLDLVARRFAGRVAIGPTFVERAMLAPWPGNVRQLLRSVEAALAVAEVDGRAAASPRDLPESPAAPREATPDTIAPDPSDDEVRHAMTVSGGNVSMAARALGIHRSRLRRVLSKLG